MREILLGLATAAVMIIPMSTAVKAHDTIVIERDAQTGDSKTLIVKVSDLIVMPVSHENELSSLFKKARD